MILRMISAFSSGVKGRSARVARMPLRSAGVPRFPSDAQESALPGLGSCDFIRFLAVCSSPVGGIAGFREKPEPHSQQSVRGLALSCRREIFPHGLIT